VAAGEGCARGQHDLAPVGGDVGLEERHVVRGHGVLDIAHHLVQRVGESSHTRALQQLVRTGELHEGDGDRAVLTAAAGRRENPFADPWRHESTEVDPGRVRRSRCRARVDDRLGPVTYGPPARSLRSIALDLQRWGRQYWWILAVCGATGGSFALNRLWEIMGLETKASADRREERILAAMDGGANDSKAREALDGGAHDRTAREAVAGGVQAASREAREAWLAARRAAALAGFDAGVVELDAGTTVTPRQ